jgi:acetyl-CoA carboxylase biotin carboxyl carrier protein
MKKTERKPKLTMRKEAPEASSQNSSAEPSSYLSLTEIKELIDLIAEKQFNEFELDRGDFRLRLQKGPGRVIIEAPPPQAAPVVMPASEVRSLEVSTPAAAPAPAPAPQEEKLHIISSPIVGTFYRSPSPTTDPFVKIGDVIEAGKTLCIIEAMKLMNEITSDATGTVAKIFVENGQPVEYGQPLFGIKV